MESIPSHLVTTFLGMVATPIAHNNDASGISDNSQNSTNSSHKFKWNKRFATAPLAHSLD